MKTKFTKGEWKIDGNFELSDNCAKYIKSEDGIILFDISPLLDGKNNKLKIKEAEANAKLTISALLLLKAAIKMKEQLPRDVSIGGDLKYMKLLNAWQELTQAIKRATQ